MYFTLLSSVSIVDFQEVNVYWDIYHWNIHVALTHIRGIDIRGVFRTLSNTNEWSFFAKIVNDFHSLTFLAKKERFIMNYWQGPKYSFALIYLLLMQFISWDSQKNDVNIKCIREQTFQSQENYIFISTLAGVSHISIIECNAS